MNLSPKSSPDPTTTLPGRPAPPGRRKVVIEAPQAVPAGTVAALVGLAGTALLLNGKEPSQLVASGAIGVGISLAMSLAADLKHGFTNLIRADVMALLAFYFLTLFEFLFPQPDFDDMIIAVSAYNATLVVLVGFAGLLVGRHLLHPKRQPFGEALTREVPAAWLTLIFWACMLIGYAHMLIAVRFNVIEMVDWMMAPRFTQPWSRDRLGDWRALLIELGLLLYLLPPLAGIILARRHRYSRVQVVLITIALLFSIFNGFASGTRNIFATYLVTFLIGYAFAVPQEKKRQLIVLSAISAVLMFGATIIMLDFRTIGLRNYLGGQRRPLEAIEQSLFVDYNLYAIGKLTEVFPKRSPYLGMEIPYQALIRPIPRAIWKGKPEGLSSSIEDSLGAEGLTIAASFAGEAFMSFGYLGVLIAGLFFGAVTGWWSFLCSPRNSELGILIYASGFFAAVISMRSLLVFTTALLPTVAAIAICVYVARLLARQATRLLAHMRSRRVPQRPRPGPRMMR